MDQEALVELRYRAVCEVLSGSPIGEVATRYGNGTSRQSPAVTQATIHSTNGYADTNMSDYEEDHVLALEDGGDPRDPRNLWPEPDSGSEGPYSKDGVESKVKNAICAGAVTLTTPQHAMLTDSTSAQKVLGIG